MTTGVTVPALLGAALGASSLCWAFPVPELSAFPGQGSKACGSSDFLSACAISDLTQR